MLSNNVILYTGANLNGNEAHCCELQAWSVLAMQSRVTLGCLVLLHVNLLCPFFSGLKKILSLQ